MARRQRIETMVFSAVFCLVMGASNAGAQDTAATGSISGVVAGSDGKPAPGVVLCLQTTSRCATTDDSGSEW